MYKHFFKRFFDFLIALIALICISPILLVVTVWLHFANKGAGAFFFQERPGKDGKIFKVIKFKSMTDERDENGNLLPDAKRLTKVGKIVRLTSIDELPQLINVLKGDMALIGPRPLLVKYLPYYTEREKLRHSVRPGITGWAQVNGRNTVEWDKRLELDAYYVEHLTMIMDVKVILKTVKNVLCKSGIVVVSNELFEDLDVVRRNRISLEELKQSLYDVDKDFVPPLSERVDLDEYAQKMIDNARFVIERDINGDIKGVVAYYADDKDSPNGFVTHVATKQKYRHQGVANRLMERTISNCKKTGKIGVNLKTSNPEALRFYKGMGFEITATSPDGEWDLHYNIV